MNNWCQVIPFSVLTLLEAREDSEIRHPTPCYMQRLTYFDPQLLKWAVWVKHCFSFKYLAKISFNQNITQLVWIPWFNRFGKLLDDFSNVFYV